MPSGVTARRASHGGAHTHSAPWVPSVAVDVGRLLLIITRVGLPIGIGVAGVVAIVVGHGTNSTAAAGVGLLIVAVIVWMINWMFRMSVASNRDREREEEARDYFARHGRWPDE